MPRGPVTGGVARKWRPSLGVVVGGTLGGVLVLPPLGMAAVWLLDGRIGLGRTALVVGLGAVAATGVLGWLLARLILGPVRALAGRAEALGRGERGALAEPIGHYGTREMGELGARVLGLARALQGREATARRFADHVTHELRTPLAAIRGAAELLGEGAPGPGDARLVATVAAAAARMERLLDELRDVARVEDADFAGRATLGAEAARLRAEWPGLAVAVEGGEVALPLSPEGLHVVLRQMAGNAAAHGARQLWLRAGPEGPTLAVEDDGEGIAEGDRGRVFDPFFTTRREAGGTGMGLHIVRRLLEAHGARIGALAREGGAAFRIDWG